MERFGLDVDQRIPALKVHQMQVNGFELGT